jgi:membrane associated rhomboid family serine protease
MFPVGDDRFEGGPPAVVTWGLVLLNVLAFMIELQQPSEAAIQSFVQAWGIVPREYAVARDLPPDIPAPFWATLFTSMFLHGGWMHLGGNMLYLWIFGDNIEKLIGHVRFLLFYLVCGLAAGSTHIVFNAGSEVPTVGASGAISGVLGGYLVLFPRNRIRVLTRGGIVPVPAIFMLGFWIVIQVISGLGPAAVGAETGGVAYLAHIGGFIAGFVLIHVFAAGRRRQQVAVA